MVRLVVPSLCTLLVALAAGAVPARAEPVGEVWEPAGPVSTSAGMTAVASDPDNPKVVWIGSATTVWVSDDEGASFSVVLQLSRASGMVRDTGSEPAEDPTDLEDDPDEQERVEDQLEEEGIDPDDLVIESGDSNDHQDGTSDDNADNARVAARFGVVRMRVYGDVLYVCTSSGLHTVSRSARTLGTGREIRFGRKVAVNDVAVTADTKIWIATDGGLVQLGNDGIGVPARGLEEDLQVRALAISEGRVVAATSRGLRIASPTADGFDRLSVGGREDGGLEDILVEVNARILVAGSNQVSRILVRPGEVPVSEASWNVPGAARLAMGRDNARWAVGAKGAWRWKPDQAFERVTDGLFDRRLSDVATGYGSLAALWSVGRSGAWRLVAESGHAYSASAVRLAKTALEGYPNGDKVLTWAVAANGSDLDTIDGWALEERLAWLLPRVELLWRWDRHRYEEFLLIPILDRRILDSVDVRPVGDDFRIMAYWDLMPAITAALDSSRSVYESSRVRARRQLEQVREVVLPLYQTWASKRVELATTEDLSLRDAIKAMLAIQRLESDLHVYTGGHFPIAGTSPNNSK